MYMLQRCSQGFTLYLVHAHLYDECGSKCLPNRPIHHHEARDHSTHNGFCHEDIWLAKPIGIRHHTHYDVALLLVKLVGMP